MNKKIYLQFIASFLIVLMINFPFYTANVFASINSVSAKGSDGIEGFIRDEDFVDFTVTASISGETLTEDQVILGADPGVKFTNCKPAVSGSDCTLRFPDSGKESFEAKQIPFTINLFKSDGSIDDQKSGNILVDNRAPQITLGINKNKFSGGGIAEITYQVTDFACSNPSCEGKCVGIKSIEISANSDFSVSGGSFSQTIEPETDECTVEDTIPVDLATFGDGLNSIFARATDNFDQVSVGQSVSFDLDSSSPTVLVSTFAIVRQGFTISTFSDNKVSVDVMVDILEKDLDTDSVKGDLFSLNPSDNSLRNKIASCAAVEDDLHTCKWTVEYAPGSEGIKNIIVTAMDLAGNEVTTTISKQLTKDDEGPVVQSLVTDSTRDGQSYGRPSGNTVTAVLDETTGLVGDDVILHVGGTNLQADECIKSSDWTCTWSNVRFGLSDTVTISIKSDTKDILLNPVISEESIEVSIDKTIPVLSGIRIEPIGGIQEVIPGLFKVGDKIKVEANKVEANITDDSQISAKADFSNLIDGATDLVADSCDSVENDDYKCVWITPRINKADSGEIVFTFTDVAGNSLTEEREIDIFELDETEVPNFWEHTVECSPRSLDREIGTLINQRMYCEVKLEKKNSRDRISTVLISNLDCTDPDSILSSFEVFNTETGSTSPIIKLTMDKDDFRIDNSSIDCSIDIFSMNEQTRKITKNVEIENVEIVLRFYNLPLGEFSKGVEEKIREAKKSASGIWETIGKLNNLPQL